MTSQTYKKKKFSFVEQENMFKIRLFDWQNSCLRFIGSCRKTESLS